MSNGQIKTGVYHSDVPDKQKEALHMKWRRGDVSVVCATIGAVAIASFLFFFYGVFFFKKNG